jgi:hypothetical protein
MLVKYRICKWCSQIKLNEDFYTERDSYCRECRKYYSREWSRENPARRFQINFRYRQKLKMKMNQ